MLPFVFHPFHQLLEARLAADVGEPGIIFIKKRIINEAAINRIFKPIQRLIIFVELGIKCRYII